MNRKELLSVAKPILFNTEMVRAILDDRKTVTRRPVKTKKYIPDNAEFGYTAFTPKDHISCRGIFYDESGDKRYGESFIKNPYKAGDILYVRETWSISKQKYIYKADDPLGTDFWRPSVHMPKEAARIFLRVTNVRVEQLQDITDEQALQEGFSSRTKFISAFLKMYPKCTEDSWVWVIEFEKVEVSK